MTKQLKHNEVVKYPHKRVNGNMNYPKDEDITDIDCDGIVTWEEALECLVCNKCQLYTGVK